MTTPSARATASACRDARACVDDDLRQLADQLRRQDRRGGEVRMHLRGLADEMRGFAGRHVASVTAAVALAAAALSLVS